MPSFYLDGSALAKRYVAETGSALVDFILDNVPERRIFLLNVDQRLLRAAQAEGLVTFNPETQDQAALATLVSR